MPMAPLRPCTQAGCPALVAHGRCAAHARIHDRLRGAAHQRGYTYRWAQHSRAWLARFPLCGMRADGLLHTEHSRCAQEGRVTAAECTDHIVAPKHGGDFWDPQNHQSLCLPCNTRKAIELEGGFGR